MITKFLLLSLLLVTLVYSQEQVGCFPKDQLPKISPINQFILDQATCEIECTDFPYYAYQPAFKRCYCLSEDDIIHETEGNKSSELIKVKHQRHNSNNPKFQDFSRRLLQSTYDLYNTGFIGSGYSYDSEQMTTEKCFSVRQATITTSSAATELDKAMTYDEISKYLKWSARVHANYFYMFMASAKHTFEEKIKDTETSLSANYYQYVERQLTGQIEGYGKESLTDFGKGVYQDGENPYFGITCGDEYVTEYSEGGMLLMSLRLSFNTASDKKKFTDRLHVGIFGNMFGVTVKIQKTATDLAINGNLQVLAFQKGGDPAQLSKVFALESETNPFSCSLQTAEECQGTIQSLLNYAAQIFPDQLSPNSNVGYIPLGERFSDFKPIKYLGLKKAKSLVTDDVKDARQFLSDELEKNNYFLQKLQPIKDNYPAALHANILTPLTTAFNKVDSNIKIIVSEDLPRIGQQGCFDTPDECVNIVSNIESQLQEIVQGDLDFLDEIKFVIVIPPDLGYSEIYQTGEGTVTVPIKNALTAVTSVAFNQTNYTYDVSYTSGESTVNETGTLTSAQWDNSFTGTKSVAAAASVETGPIAATNSTYFFEPNPLYYDNCVRRYKIEAE